MNRKVEIPFGLGVDRHNRVPQDGGSMLRSMRNLLLDDQNELVLRKAMEYRETVVRSNQTTGGLIAALTSNVDEDAVLPVLKQPLCLWLPPFLGANPNGVRHHIEVFRHASDGNALLCGGTAFTALLPKSRRRPQSVFWRDALWIACDGAPPVPSHTQSAIAPTGLIRVGLYATPAGVPTYTVVCGMPVEISDTDRWSKFWSLTPDPTYSTVAASLRPRVIGIYKGRMVLANFPVDQYGNQRSNGIMFSDFLPSTPTTFSSSGMTQPIDYISIPIFGSGGVDPFTTRLGLVGDDGEEIVGVKELSLMQLGAMNQSALLILKDRSVWLMTGEYLSTPDVGKVTGDSVPIKQPIEDGCASFETVVETPWGVIWAGHDDVYFMANGGGAPVPIGRKIAKQLKNTPFDMQYLWHGAYHEGYYRLSIMAPGQQQDNPVAMEETWCLDLRYGPPADWTQARWFGPHVYQPIGAVNGDTDDAYRGVFITAVEKRTGYKKELFALQPGKDAEVDNYAWVLCGLDGEDTRDWSLPFSPLQFRPSGTAELGLAKGEKRVVAAAGWLHGRKAIVTTAGDSNGGEPTWTDAVGNTVADGTVVWTMQGSMAVPANFRDLLINDGEDAVPTQRSNEILPMLRSMELPAETPNRDVQFRGLEIGASGRDAMTWALQGLKDQLGQGSSLDYQGGEGNFLIGKTALDTRINDPVKPFAMWVDSSGVYDSLVVGKHVSFALAEYPYFNIMDDELSFSFVVSATAGASPPSSILKATVTTALIGNGTNFLKTILDAMCDAMNAALLAQSIGGGNQFTHNLTTNPATCPVKPAITLGNSGGTWKWYPYSFTDQLSQLPVEDYGIPSLWLKTGFDPIGPEWGFGGFSRTVVAPFSPWQRNVPKLRITSLTAVLRSFRRGPL